MVVKRAPIYVNLSETKNSPAYINDDAFIQQALFLGSHDKVMSVVPVVHNVLQINTCVETSVMNLMLHRHYYSNLFIGGT